MTDKWKPGDRAYVSEDANGLGGGVFTVAKVGRKWITIQGYRARQFDIVTGKENNPSGVGGYCYARTSEEHARWSARQAILLRIDNTHQMMAFGAWRMWPLDRLRRLCAVLEETDESGGGR